VLNKTNFTALALMFGDDSDGWRHARIVLYPSRIEFKGKSMPTIKVKRAPTKTNNNATPFNEDIAF
jgi:hypothetical protein